MQQQLKRSLLTRKMKVGLGNLLSRFISVNSKQIAFVTKNRVPFGGNLRCVAEEVLSLGRHTVVIYCDGPIADDTRRALEGRGAVVRSGFSLANFVLILRSGIVCVSHSIRDAHIYKRHEDRRIINLWHGVPLKRIELLMEKQLTRSDPAKLALIRHNAALYDHLIASGPSDARWMAQAFGVDSDKVYDLGLPRFDIMADTYTLPDDMAAQETRLKALAAGRSIILYSPTFREKTPSPFALIDERTISLMATFASKHDCVFALRPHPYDQHSARHLFDRNFDFVIDASSTHFPETAVVLRQTDCLISDYSSIWVDFTLRDRPVFGLMPDIETYKSAERNFIYDMETVFPGPMMRDWDSLLSIIDAYFASNSKQAIQGGHFIPDEVRARVPNITQELTNLLLCYS